MEVLNAVKQFQMVAKVVDQDGQNSALTVDQPLPDGPGIPNTTFPVPADNQIHKDATVSTQISLKKNKETPSSNVAAALSKDQFSINVHSQQPSPQILASPSYFALEFAISGDKSSLGSRLLHMTLSSGYQALRGSSGHITDLGVRIFGLTLSYRNRDDILSEFQWWLGPGQPLASRLKQARQYPGVPTSDTYLSVDDVAMLLHDVGAINTQDDVLEFSNPSNLLDGPESSMGFNDVNKYDDKGLHTFMSKDYVPSYEVPAWRSKPALQAFNFNSLMGNFVQKEGQDEGNYRNASPIIEEDKRRRIPISVFLQSLANISVCLSIGPGYPQQAVKALIYASISGFPFQ
ncbi:hypothetical protein TARUN_7049 [Trichoderma arundinaceum]|uniref:Uncharacterized protein n=1 Tax=Trichoderma arundinaceum TaxID=490622 RepID=A0A395NGP8_TRIAR|nr:hypothetical protein TARUN_7049 [Trichoderma arundinaceum]